MDLEQHFTTGTVLAHLRSLLSNLDLAGRHVLEIGAGKGALTELLLERGAIVTAFEIEPNLCSVRHPRLTLREEDATRADLASVKADLKAEIAASKSELKAEIAAIRADMQAMEMRLTIKLGALMVVAVGMIATLMKH